MIKTLNKLKLKNNLQNTKVTFFRSVKVAKSNVIESQKRKKRHNGKMQCGILDGIFGQKRTLVGKRSYMNRVWISVHCDVPTLFSWF